MSFLLFRVRASQRSPLTVVEDPIQNAFLGAKLDSKAYIPTFQHGAHLRLVDYLVKLTSRIACFVCAALSSTYGAEANGSGSP